MGWKKSKGGTQDLTFGLGTETQLRIDKNETITQISGAAIPHVEGTSVSDALDSNASQITLVNADLSNHISDRTNPHLVTIGQIGGAPAVHTHATDEVLGLDVELALKPNYAEVYQRTEFINISLGVQDAGSPIVLDQFGKIDSTIMGTGLALVGSFTPTVGTEYPDLTGQPDYPYWIIDGVGVGYTYTTGDLIGQLVTDGDSIIKGIDAWVYRAGVDEAAAYYRLDGGVAISAPLAGGNQQAKNFAAATDGSDLVTLTQVTALDASYLKLDGSTPMAQALPMGSFKIVNLADGVLDTDATTLQQLNAATVDKIDRTAANGSAVIPTGTILERDAAPVAGLFRYNLDNFEFEGYSEGSWGAIGGGGAIDDVFYENAQSVSKDYTILSARNAMTAGPISVNAGITVTIEDGATWVIT